MTMKTRRALLVLLSFFLCFPGSQQAAAAAVAKFSPKVFRVSQSGVPPASDFSAAALSTTSLQWSWSTGSFTGSGITGYYLYSSSTADRISLTPETSFYIDAGLSANKPVTRWLTAYTGAVLDGDSAHVSKYTFAEPPSFLTVSTATAESVYVTWHYSSATAYAIECSTNGGADYSRNRDAFVPWQTIPLISNKNYMLRIGAVNNDNERTPGLYSPIKTFTTPPLTLSTFTAVALSSFTIEWRWSTGTFTGTGITGYRLYHSTTTADAELPADDYDGEAVAFVPGADTNSWIETFVEGSTTPVAANSRHTRWIKAVGILESQGKPVAQKYTYAIAPSTITARYLDPDPYYVLHVTEQSATFIWSPRFSGSEASGYVVEFSTAGDFAVALSTKIAGGSPDTVSGLTDNTKYDFRMGALNGDNEQTPDNGLNPFAYTQGYKIITSPHAPSDFAGTPYTDTALDFTWSTTTYRNPSYITGYTVAERRYDEENQLYYLYAVAFMPGVSSSRYTLDYLITNSTHTRYIWASQEDPDWAADPHYPVDPECYYHHCAGPSPTISATGATFATPPNDLSFDTVTARSVGIWWREPVVSATQYRIERSSTIGEGGPWVFLANSTGTHYNDTGLTPETTYSYRIGAINQLGVQTLGLAAATGGNRRDYSFVSSTMTPHRAPTLYAVATGTNSISWWWTNDVPGVQSFNLYTSTGGRLATALSAATTYWIEAGLPLANAIYSRRVRSVTFLGEGDFHETSAATLANPPSGLTVTAAGRHTLSIGWAGNGGTRFKIDRSLDMASWTPVKAWADVHVSTAFADTGLELGTTYYYAVAGYNMDGILTTSSATSSGASQTLPLPAGIVTIYSTSAVTQSQSAVISGLGTITVELPAGAAPSDGYIILSTSAGTAPEEVSKPDLDIATGRLLPNLLIPGSVAELSFYDVFGGKFSGNFSRPARIVLQYPDANADDIVDGISPQAGVNTLRILNLDTSALVWRPVRNFDIDKVLKTVSSYVDHFSIYSLGSLTSAAGPMDSVFAYPNPYRPGSSGDFGQSIFGDGVVFESMPAGATVRIFNIAGGLVEEIEDTDRDGRAMWNAKTRGGGRAASGVYLYLVTAPGHGTKRGKISVIR